MKAFRVLFFAAAAVFIFTGCKALEPENAADRPWNSQRGWEHGLPSTINQGR
jgi:hypothetical protein